MNLEPCPGCGFFRVVGRECACCEQDAAKSPHVVSWESHLTPRTDGTYVQIGRAMCLRCGESFYFVLNVVTPLTRPMDAELRANAVDFGAMIQKSPCRGGSHADT